MIDVIDRDNPVPDHIRKAGKEVFNLYIEQRILDHNLNVRAAVEMETSRLMFLHEGNIICPDCGMECHHNGILQHRRTVCINKRL